MAEELYNLAADPETPTGVVADWITDHPEANVKKICVVYGATGEYEDRSEWNVAAFLSKEAAEALAGRLNKWLEERGMHRPTCKEGIVWNWQEEHGLPAEDPSCNVDYTGADYHVTEVPLRG